MKEHLTDNQLIQYINKRETISADVLKAIETHLHIKKCGHCISRIEEISEFNRIISEEADDEELEIYSVCQQSDLVYQYISGKMNAREKVAFEEHLSVCDECRELSAVLALEFQTCQDGENILEGAWKILKHGIYRLAEPFLLYVDEINNKVPSIAYRNGTETDEKGTITLELPDESGKVRFQFDKSLKITSKLFIELVDIKEDKLLIEVYDTEGHLLKSEEGSSKIACFITTGAGVLVIDKKYEIPFEYGNK